MIEAPDAGANAAPAAPVRVLGVRHHGPGSARAVVSALEAYQPDCVLIEGPADADELIGWAGDAGMEPPVSLLAWRTDEPRVASFWPLAVFSPEWQAMRWAAGRGVQTRFMDLPARHVLAHEQAEDTGDGAADGAGGEAPARAARTDPIAELARLAGYDDPEAWWEDAVELRMEGEPFEPLIEAIAMLRQSEPERDEWTLRREAHMRKVLRAARRAGHERVAVVCGAWHAPALTGKPPTVKEDNALLARLPRVKTRMTWVPWTHQRLSASSGYGAGVTSPGWYHHLFSCPDHQVVRWLTGAARCLREHDLPASSAHVIEATRLAEALAALRGRPMPGLEEINEATWSVLCEGHATRAELVTRDVVVGQALGVVPDGVPMVPLDADLRATAKRLRLPFEALVRSLVLDLRKPMDLERSKLLHRLVILGVDWGSRRHVGGTGTFKEGWELAWRPELAVDVVTAAAWGTTVAAAAGHALLERTSSLAEVTEALERALTADLGEVIPQLLRLLDQRAAAESDVVGLLAAVPALVRVERYGDVRATSALSLARVTRAILARACAGLPAASAGAGQEAAAAVRDAVDKVHDVAALLDEDGRHRWHESLLATLGARELPGILAGRLTRILLDSRVLTTQEAAGRMGRALTPGTDPQAQAAWIEGFLAGDPLLILEGHEILPLLDEWVRRIDDRGFIDVLPALRRALGAWPPAARRALARRLAQCRDSREEPEPADDSQMLAFAAPVLATVGTILEGGR